MDYFHQRIQKQHRRMAFHISSPIYRGKRVLIDKETMGKFPSKSEEMDAEKRTLIEGTIL